MKKENIKYIFLFILFFIAMNFFFIAYRVDTYSNYAFSYALANGQLPYKDINFIVPPFSPYIYSILLLLNKSIIFFYIEQCLLLVLLCYLLFKMLDNKAWIVILLLFCPYFFGFTSAIFPGYNFMVFLELVLLIYLEVNNKDDRLVGIVSALTILTKHNIGIFIFLVSIIYPLFKDYKKSIKRLLYGLIPMLLFLIYLLLTSNLYNFINFCLLGMFEFKSNQTIDFVYLVIIIITYLIMIVKFIKEENKNITYYYFFIYILVTYPLVDLYHTAYYFLLFLIVLLYNSKFNIKNKYIFQFSILLIIFFMSSYYLIFKDTFSSLNMYRYNNFPFEVLNRKEKAERDKIIKFIKNKKVIFISYRPDYISFYMITTNKKMNRYLVQYVGNYGKDGYRNIIEDLSKEKNTYFLVYKNTSNSDTGQFYKKLPNNVKDNYEYIKDIGNYHIYYNN